jgi:uncharacterized oxidoreductase
VRFRLIIAILYAPQRIIMTDVVPSIAVRAEPLKALVCAIVAGAGSEAREAELVAEQLVGANLTGHDSHGVGMLPRYIENVQAGGLHINQHVTVVRDAGPLLTLNGNAGFGQVMGYEAMARGIERAAEFGVAVVALANSHHVGRIGHWAEQCIAAGYVSMHYVNVLSDPVVAPFGGRDARFVTNPFCVGIPVPGQEPIVLDFATSRIAVGKVRVAMNKGEQVKPGILLDHDGEPTTNPRALFSNPHGAIVPFGEHKGYALAMVCELLGGALTGGGTMHYRAKNRTIINNMLSIVIDPNRLGTGADMASETATFIEWVKQSPVAQGADRIKMPGEPERDYRRDRSATGIPIDKTTWAEIIEAARKMGIDKEKAETLAGVAGL